MNTAIPFAVGASTTEPSSEIPERMTTAPASSSPGATNSSGHQPARLLCQQRRRGVDDEDVDAADRRGREEPAHEEPEPAERAYDQRLQQAALRVAAHRARA